MRERGDPLQINAGEVCMKNGKRDTWEEWVEVENSRTFSKNKPVVRLVRIDAWEKNIWGGGLKRAVFG